KEIKAVIKDLKLKEVDFVVEHPEDMNHGDFACNVAMKGWSNSQNFNKETPSSLPAQAGFAVPTRHSAGSLVKESPLTSHLDLIGISREGLTFSGPRELAEKIVKKLHEGSLKKLIKKIEVAGPGFINISIQKDYLIKETERVLRGDLKKKVKWGKKVMVEYAHPNTHKQFHIGHLRNILLGESISRLLETVGIKVIRTNYQGDVGLHIAKAIWGILSISKDYNLVKNKSIFKRIEFLGKAYAKGAKAYEDSEKAKKEIIEFNQQIYEGKGKIIELWKETRGWSLEYFDLIYKRVGTKYDKFYFESECGEGLEIAKKALKKRILKKSKGAVVFDGSKYDLDTRVFINSIGLGTYEAKELGLAPQEFSDFGEIDKCIHVVGPEQKSFFEVTFKVEELIDPKMFKDKQYHRVYELVDLKKGKMSSRTGKVVTGWWLMDEAVSKIKKNFKVDDETAEKIGVGAVKYGFLKIGPMQRIAFDMDESVSLSGNSGPYLQYTYARCQSVLLKVPNLANFATYSQSRFGTLTEKENVVLRSLYRFEEVLAEAAEELSPNLVCNFLYDLAQKYNSFYNKHRILKADKEDQKEFRLWLTMATKEILKKGLGVLGIKVLEKM
ncbi:MAG: arginine--tRNA ligase, partial [Patescibacteria group bacterium]|nr:arginine--tRNA ligase [Patescibacteria group bacterium]